MGRWYILGGPPAAAGGCGVGLPLEDIAAGAPRARRRGRARATGWRACGS
uniref:Uncharacterized protein n=1 Tax=Arundo donax TaxID=35708 RepID=A0A0A9R6M1_ARUDO